MVQIPWKVMEVSYSVKDLLKETQGAKCNKELNEL